MENKFECPHCKKVYDDWYDYLDETAQEGEFVMECENTDCQKEFNLEFETKMIFKTKKV